MPAFELTAHVTAPVEEVWKLLHDPSRFPEWWVGIETVQRSTEGYTMWPTGYPDFPMPQQLKTDRDAGCVTISCLVSDLEFVWRLWEVGEETGIVVQVRIPEAEAHRFDTQRALIAESLQRLAEAAAGS